MMPWSVPEPTPVALLLAGRNALREIDERDDRNTEALMSALLRAAWPTLRAQKQ